MQKRKKVVQGGTSSGKTYAIIPIIIDRCTKSKLKATVVAETLPAVKEGAMDIFVNIMQETGRWIDANWNASSLTYTFSLTKSRIQFKSFDSVGKAKSSGKRDILFLNEANHISYAIADALMIRSIETFIDFNPDNEFWAHKEVLTEPNSEFLSLTYDDNEAIPAETLEDLFIKRSKAYFNPELPLPELLHEKNVKDAFWDNWWRVYGLGKIGSLEGVIFNNWTIIEQLPPDARYERSGMDFGYTNDPTTTIDKYIWNGQKIYDEVLYQKGLVNSDIAQLLKMDGVKRRVIADSAEPKSIKELNNYGINTVGAIKGADSISFGIQAMQQEPFLVTARSINLISELRKYRWAKDREGNSLNEPIGAFNHCIDAVRYIESDSHSVVKLKARSSSTF